MIIGQTSIVIQSEAKNLGNIHVDVLVHVTEILPPFGRLNDNEGGIKSVLGFSILLQRFPIRHTSLLRTYG